MIQILEKALQYLSTKRGDDISYLIEFNLLTQLKNELEWKSLTPEEKQAKRKSLLELAQKNLESQHTNGYKLEKACFQYYDNCRTIINFLGKVPNKNIDMIRLELLIKKDIEILDRELHLRDKKLIPFAIYKRLFFEINQSGVLFQKQEEFLRNSYILCGDVDLEKAARADK